MSNDIGAILTKVGEELKEQIDPKSDWYGTVDLGRVATDIVGAELGAKYEGVHAVVPLKKPESGITVSWGGFPGENFAGYIQLESGVAVPSEVAHDSGLPGTGYQPPETMYLKFS